MSTLREIIRNEELDPYPPERPESYWVWYLDREVTQVPRDEWPEELNGPGTLDVRRAGDPLDCVYLIEHTQGADLRTDDEWTHMQKEGAHNENDHDQVPR